MGAAVIGSPVSIRLLMIGLTLLRFWRNRAFSSLVTPLMTIAPLTLTRLILPIHLVDQLTSGSRGCLVVGLRLGTSPSPALTSAFKLGPTLHDPTSTSRIFSSVESRKIAFLDTASQCTKAGFSFCLLILEAVGGGWSDALRSVVAWIARECKRSGPIDGSDASFKIAPRISCTPSQGKRARNLEASP